MIEAYKKGDYAAFLSSFPYAAIGGGQALQGAKGVKDGVQGLLGGAAALIPQREEVTQEVSVQEEVIQEVEVETNEKAKKAVEQYIEKVVEEKKRRTVHIQAPAKPRCTCGYDFDSPNYCPLNRILPYNAFYRCPAYDP